MKIYMCEHVSKNDKDNTQIPYIYDAGPLDCPHFCIRVNHEGYLFIFLDKDVPKWITEDSNIKDLGGDSDSETMSSADKTEIESKLKVSATNLAGTKESIWEKLLVNKSIGLTKEQIYQKLLAGKRVYSAIRNEYL